MPGAAKTTKIFKLKPTDGPLNRDDVSTWIFTVQSFARQNGWSKFLPGGDYSTWVATDDDINNDLSIPDDATETNKLRDSFKDFITAIAANCPTGFTDTVIRESTSFKWIEEKIKKTFNLTTRGESFLDGLNLTFKFDDSFTYSQAWMMIKDQYISSLLSEGNRYMGKIMPARETISPLAMNFLVREWLLKIDARLPEHVRTSRGHLFTTERPTLACNQQILCDQIDIMLQELDGKDSSSNVNSVNVSYIPSRGGRTGSYRGRQARPNFHRGRGAPPSQRYQTPVRRANHQSCHLCLEARRYDSSITHSATTCPFPALRRNNTRQHQPQFKVLLVPTSNPTLPSPATYLDQHMENMTLGTQSSNQQQLFAAYDQDPARYDGQQDAQYEGDSQYLYEDDNFGPATIEELSPL